jgi:hypothetical protein
VTGKIWLIQYRQIGEAGRQAFDAMYFIGEADGYFFVAGFKLAFDDHAITKFGVMHMLAGFVFEFFFSGHGRDFRAQFKLALEALRAWRGEAARARLRGMWVGVWQLPRAWRKRRAIQAARTVPVEQIEAMLWPPQS